MSTKEKKVKPVTILSGPIGAGKSTVACELIDLLPKTAAYIEGDKFWSFIGKESMVQGRRRNFITIMVSMTAAAVPFAVAGYDVILDFSIPPWFLEIALKVLKVRDIPLNYVVLKPSEAECAARAASRNEGKITDYSLYHDLYASFDIAERHIIQNDNIIAPAVALRILDGLKTGTFLV